MTGNSETGLTKSRFLKRMTFRGGSNSGSGLIEAVAWTFGYLFAQAIVLVGLFGLLLTAAFGFVWPDQDQVIKLALDLELDRSFLLVGATSLGVLFLIVPAVRLREGAGFRERIGWRTPTRDELVYSLATVAPIAVLGDLIYDVASNWQQHLTGLWPVAAALRETPLTHLHRSLQGVPYPFLVVALALGPAIGEELVFRGVIGRRLVKRWGIWKGVLATSLCFAVAHGSPAHAIATLPIAVLLHMLYLYTGTIWIPILVHFCNNLLAVTMVRFHLGTDAPVPPAILVMLTLYLIAILLLFRVRTREWLTPITLSHAVRSEHRDGNGLL